MQAIRTSVILSALLIGGCSFTSNPAVSSGTVPLPVPVQRSKAIVIDTFTSPTYGNSLPSPLTADGAGNYYGTTSVGGEGYGTLYELSPSGKGGSFGLGVAFRFHHAANRWVETVLHDFGNGNAYPFNTLVMDRAGNLYGTDNVYHDGGGITEGVYEISPSGSGWKFKIIYDLGTAAANGASGGLVLDAKGNIFGISSGFIGHAIAFELKPSGSSWNPITLFTFTKGYPTGAPVLDTSANIYDTNQGGRNTNGSIFELSPSGSGPWKLKTLYAFKGGTDGSVPYAGIAFDASGNIYGTTIGGGSSNLGTVFELKAATHAESVLWSFYGGDGRYPLTPVVLDNAGIVFGTTSSGGADPGCLAARGCGDAFEIIR